MTLAASQERPNLIGQTRATLTSTLESVGVAPEHLRMRTNQLWQWIYQKGTRDFFAMSNMSKAFRALMAEHFVIEVPVLTRRLISVDGTRKYLFRLTDGNEIETVYIPDEGRGTLCVSSQVGCTLNCRFCHTGRQALVRNLSVAEIVGQVMAARDDLNDWPRPGRGHDGEHRLISNIVLMGMGEPLYNLDNVRDAVVIAMDGEGISISRRRITLSTAGVVPGIARAGSEIGCRLAISLHATTDAVRDQIVPINRKWNIAELFATLRSYPGLSNADRITFEYVMLEDVNDHDDDARRLVELLRGLPAKVNLIPFNAWPGAPYGCSAPERIASFSRIVRRAGYACPVRTPRGADIMAACGQLKSDSARQRRNTRCAA